MGGVPAMSCREWAIESEMNRQIRMEFLNFPRAFYFALLRNRTALFHANSVHMEQSGFTVQRALRFALYLLHGELQQQWIKPQLMPPN